MTYTPRTTSDAMIAPPVAKAVTLPALPFAIPPATIDETAPRAAMIRGEMTQERKDWLRRYDWYSARQTRVKTGTVTPDALRDAIEWVRP